MRIINCVALYVWLKQDEHRITAETVRLALTSLLLYML